MAGDSEDYLTVTDVRKTYRTTVALQSVSLSVRRGEFLVLLGESGCGKSTLLRIIAGLLAADKGSIRLDGATIDALPAHRRDIGLVFQSYALFPHMSVGRNVRFGLDMRRVAKTEADRRIASALDLVKLSGFTERMPSELSGGQQQRVALARAIVIQPRLLLLDEPLSNLDAVLRASVRVDIRELHERTGLTTIMVTHDQAEAMTLADSIAVMKNGGILQHDTPERIYEDPAEVFVASFVGSPPAAIVSASRGPAGTIVVGGMQWTPPTETSNAISATRAEKFRMALRPERLSIAAPDAPGALKGRIRSVEYLGAERLVHVQMGDERLIVRRSGPVPDTDGEVGILVDHVPPFFDAETGIRLKRA